MLRGKTTPKNSWQKNDQNPTKLKGQFDFVIASESAVMYYFPS